MRRQIAGVRRRLGQRKDDRPLGVIGARPVAECVDFARGVGYRKITLWTQSILTSARHIYQAAGFRLVREEPHHSFGHDLVGEYLTLKF